MQHYAFLTAAEASVCCSSDSISSTCSAIVKFWFFLVSFWKIDGWGLFSRSLGCVYVVGRLWYVVFLLRFCGLRFIMIRRWWLWVGIEWLCKFGICVGVLCPGERYSGDGYYVVDLFWWKEVRSGMLRWWEVKILKNLDYEFEVANEEDGGCLSKCMGRTVMGRYGDWGMVG